MADLAEQRTVQAIEPSAPHWAPVALSDRRDAARTAAQMRASLAPEHFEQDAEWQSLHCDPGDQMVALIDRDEQGLHGMMSGRIHASAIAFQIGGVALARAPLRVMTIHGGAVTRRHDAPAATAGAIVAALAAGPSAIFLDAVPDQSPLHALLAATDGAIHDACRVLPWAETRNGRINWAGSVDEYLKTIGKGTRKDLKRCASDLLSDPAHNCHVRRFSTPSEVEGFLADGIAISDKTYQKKQLGLGLSRAGKLEAQMRFAADRNAFLGHILYVDGAPIAFQYGYVYAGTYFAQQIGYDPAWKTVQPGSVLFIELLRDLEKLKLAVKVLDFGQGMNHFKERTTNEHRVIRHYYLFPRSAKGFTLYVIARSMSDTRQFLQRTIEALRLRDTVKSLLQRWTGHGRMQ